MEFNKIVELIVVLLSFAHFWRCVYRYKKHRIKPSNMDILVMLILLV